MWDLLLDFIYLCTCMHCILCAWQTNMGCRASQQSELQTTLLKSYCWFLKALFLIMLCSMWQSRVLNRESPSWGCFLLSLTWITLCRELCAIFHLHRSSCSLVHMPMAINLHEILGPRHRGPVHNGAKLWTAPPKVYLHVDMLNFLFP